MSQKPQPDSRERLADAISQEKSLNVCARHPTGTVYFDGPDGACPACVAIREWLEMTDDQKVRRETLEQAAQEAKKYGLGHEGDSIAAAIRRLKFPARKQNE